MFGGTQGNVVALDGQFLAYVRVDGELLNESLVRQGLARAAPYPGDSQARARRIEQAEGAARQSRLGIWSKGESRMSPSSR